MVNSREKGKRGERQAVAWFRRQGWHATRTAQHRGSAGSPDIEVRCLEDLHIEVKVGKRMPDVYAAMDQAVVDCEDEAVPVVMAKRDRHKWLFILDEAAFDAIVSIVDLGEWNALTAQLRRQNNE